MKTLMLFVAFLSFIVNAYSQEAKVRTEKIAVKTGTAGRESLTLADLGISKVPKYHALIIGVSEYKFSGPKLTDLDKPVQDAERLHKVLTTRYSFDSENVILMKDPTYQELSDVLLQLTEKVGNDENLLIFYAGHGFYDKQREFGYWIPSDATMESRANWVSNTTLRDNIGSIKHAKHTLLITDACFGGSIFKGSRGAYEADLITKFKDTYRNRSRKGMTSGNLTEVPDQSIFIQQIIKVLEDNQEPYISGFGLFNKVYETVTNNSAAVPQYGVVQGVGDEGGGDFIFIRR